jgi:hypothetical protein
MSLPDGWVTQLCSLMGEAYIDGEAIEAAGLQQVKEYVLIDAKTGYAIRRFSYQ